MHLAKLLQLPSIHRCIPSSATLCLTCNGLVIAAKPTHRAPKQRAAILQHPDSLSGTKTLTQSNLRHVNTGISRLATKPTAQNAHHTALPINSGV